MSTQYRTIIGTIDCSIQSLKNLKEEILSSPSDFKDRAFAVGGLVGTLVSVLITECEEVLLESAKSNDAEAVSDIREIGKRFNDFIERMLNHE